MNRSMEMYFHLGLTKVASTYFQQLVFPNLAGVTYYPKHQYRRYREIVASSTKGKFLFSTEKDWNVVEAVEEITGLFPDARIILFVRRHDDWLLSRYRYRIRQLGNESFPEFFDLDEDSGIWKRDELLLKPKIEAIERLCLMPPLVLTYDLLKEDPGEFLSRLTGFMGVAFDMSKHRRKPIHSAFSEKQLIILRKWNRFFTYKPLPNAGPLKRKIHRKYHEFILHTIAFFVRFIPRILLNKKMLLTAEDHRTLKRVREYYADDWAFCQDYCQKNSKAEE